MWEKFKIIGSSIWSFVLPFLRQMMTSAGPILAQAALAAVAAVASNAQGLTDSQKRDAAFKEIVKNLESQGIKIGVDVGTSLINTALEVAIQKVKADQPVK